MSGVVLVVEDDRELREVVRRYLERDGCTVHTTGSGAEALSLLAGGGVDLVVLDLGLPDVDGLEVLAAARQQQEVPVVVLTARSQVEDRIDGLRRGADDYVTKPFSPTELVLRVKAVLHRTQGADSGGPESPAFGGGRLRIDDTRHEAHLDGIALELTPTEWGLLTALAAIPGRVFSRYELVNRVRGYEFAGYERTIDSHVKNLRRKLGDNGAEIVETVLGVGYRLGWSRDH
ncbi:response regulator transcription factor [Actinoplanes derwentensis]|uniref:DNA-binding response regulator, OmpR family, contains REC and winged-helix (WHTH) domain n=1 Tax=Actinoplanes derwentensis TaxID=113562 RepID=A0A1H2DE53_9ACTN|nr:response regulator transcription factor [Actinoplanes derwentensis]GID90422.1 DNA-binding response regulator [Actinoplanes derwentensis]SDT80854.1 DNA-binding response regulator, OmpR family, contains REC and winged-helix (wHTH) domain [Actinoplanes derwentensis]